MITDDGRMMSRLKRHGVMIGLAVSTVLCITAPSAHSSCLEEPGSELVATFGYPGSNNPLGSDCPSLCKKWVASCKKVAKSNNSCASATYKALFDLVLAECKGHVIPADRDECLVNAKAYKKVLLEAYKADTAQATLSCSNRQAECGMVCPTL